MNITKVLGWAVVIVVVVGGVYYTLHRSAPSAAPSAQIANPASTNCVEKGGQLEIVDTPEGQSGICHLPSGQACEEWALFRGECGAEVSLASDLLPLYAGVSWGAVQPASFASLSLAGYEASSSPITNITDIAAVTKPFETYYRNKLVAAGWKVDITREAGGPGALIEAYQKGGEHILYGYTTVFKGTKPNEPVQCPCDTTLFVFSTATSTKVSD